MCFGVGMGGGRSSRSSSQGRDAIVNSQEWDATVPPGVHAVAATAAVAVHGLASDLIGERIASWSKRVGWPVTAPSGTQFSSVAVRELGLSGVSSLTSTTHVRVRHDCSA